MADNKLIGQNYTTPDLVAKVTGKAKYAEDYRVEGMLFAKLLVSPMPHARVKRCDTSAAMAMPGVKAILRAEEMPGAAAGATLGEGVQASAQAERGLTDEPLYYGEPVLAVAAIDEATAAEAIEKIDIEFEPLPFVVDPIESPAAERAERAHAGQRLGAADGAARGAWRPRSCEFRGRRERGDRRRSTCRDAGPGRRTSRRGGRGRAAAVRRAAPLHRLRAARHLPLARRPALQPLRAADVAAAARPRVLRLRRSRSTNGPTRTSETPATARCRSARRPTSGCSATSTRR